MHHRRLEQQPALDDLGEGRHRLVAADAGLVHAVEDEVGVVGEIGAAADAPEHQPLPLHHRQRAAHRGAAGVQLLRQFALVGKLGAGHHQPVADAPEQRAIDQRRRRPVVGGDGGQLRQRDVGGSFCRFLGEWSPMSRVGPLLSTIRGAMRIDQRTTSTGTSGSCRLRQRIEHRDGVERLAIVLQIGLAGQASP